MTRPKDKTPMAFGKYKGKTPEEIANVDPSYVVWMYDTIQPKHCSLDLRNVCDMDCRQQEDDCGITGYDLNVGEYK